MKHTHTEKSGPTREIQKQKREKRRLKDREREKKEHGHIHTATAYRIAPENRHIENPLN